MLDFSDILKKYKKKSEFWGKIKSWVQTHDLK